MFYMQRADFYVQQRFYVQSRNDAPWRSYRTSPNGKYGGCNSREGDPRRRNQALSRQYVNLLTVKSKKGGSGWISRRPTRLL